MCDVLLETIKFMLFICQVMLAPHGDEMAGMFALYDFLPLVCFLMCFVSFVFLERCPRCMQCQSGSSASTSSASMRLSIRTLCGERTQLSGLDCQTACRDCWEDAALQECSQLQRALSRPNLSDSFTMSLTLQGRSYTGEDKRGNNNRLPHIW